MLYTNKSLVLMWLVVFGLVALAGSRVVTGPWLICFVLVALAAPALILRGQRPVGVTTSPEHTSVSSNGLDRPGLGLSGADVYRWENEGGATAMYVGGTIRDPAHAIP